MDAPVGDDSNFVIKVVSTVMDLVVWIRAFPLLWSVLLTGLVCILNVIASCNLLSRCNELAARPVTHHNHYPCKLLFL